MMTEKHQHALHLKALITRIKDQTSLQLKDAYTQYATADRSYPEETQIFSQDSLD